MTPIPKPDRRERARLTCQLGVELYAEGTALTRGLITNISLSGCCVEMTTLPGNKGELKIAIWISETKIKVKGVICGRRPGFGVGIKFTEMSEETRETLQRFLQSRLAARGR